MALDPLAGMSCHTRESSRHLTGGRVPLYLEFVVNSANCDSDWIVIDGEVMNEEDQLVIDGRVVGALYDEEWRVLGCELCYLDNSALGPGESSTFELTFTDRDDEDALHYFVQAEGDWP